MNSRPDYDSVVVGGGFYGCVLAQYLRHALGHRTLLVEAGTQLLARASYVNQARVHRGYHYPRSLLTGYRSRVNFDRFLGDYRDCIDGRFTSYYAIGRLFSKVTAAQFRLFCQRIGAPLDKASSRIRGLFNPDLIEDVFEVREVAFDAVKLRKHLTDQLNASGVEVRLGTAAERVEQLPHGGLTLSLSSNGTVSRATSTQIFNCTYSRMNRLLATSALPPLALKYELTELALVEVPEPLREIGITVMCGPFFSVVPFPPRERHSFSHVRYTPHCQWHDGPGGFDGDPYHLFERMRKETHYVEMVKDASRYLPLLKESRYVDSIWEIKTVLPSSEVDDSRPILFRSNHGLKGLTCILGSKLDNVYDMIDFTNDAVAVGRG